MQLQQGWFKLIFIWWNTVDHYTKYCIYCHMVFNAIVVTFLMTLIGNKFIIIVIPTLQVWYILHPNNFVMKCCHG